MGSAVMMGTTNSGKLVYSHLQTGNYYKIKILSIDYSTGAITLEPNEAQFTTEYSTTIRVTIRPEILGNRQALIRKYLPEELWSFVGAIRYAISVGDNKIKLCKSATEILSTITDTGSVDLDFFYIHAEKIRRRTVPTEKYVGLNPEHRYRIRAVCPNGVGQFVAGLEFVDRNGLHYTDYNLTGYRNKIPSINESSQGNYTIFETDSYSNVTLRGIHYSYSGDLIIAFPLVYEAEIYPVHNLLTVCDYRITAMIIGSGANDRPVTRIYDGRIYLHNEFPYSVFFSLNGNANTCVDGSLLSIVDLGKEVTMNL